MFTDQQISNQWMSLKTIYTDASPEVSVLVSGFMQRFTALWWQCNSRLPDGWPMLSPGEQTACEREMDHFLGMISPMLRHPPQNQEKRLQTQAQLTSAARRTAKCVFGLSDAHLDALHIEEFTENVAEFARMARRFDPLVSVADIYQAGRNVVTTHLLQLLWGLPVELNPAIFAYSMLYPYSDNYLDDPDLTPDDKLAFSERFRQRLLGKDIQPANANEQRIFALVTMIEEQYERLSYPHVYGSLLAIHQGQTKSLAMLHKAGPYEVDVLGISLEKGGTSTLADGYLAAGNLTPLQAEFAFGLGAFLQLGDDLEDVLQDQKSGIQTVFTQNAAAWPLDGVTNRTMQFGLKVLELLEALKTPWILQDFIQKSLFQPFVTAIHRARWLYTKRYRRDVEALSAFRYSHLERQKRWLYRQRAAFGRVTEALMDDL